MPSYLPTSESLLVIWIQTFAAALATHAATLGIDPATLIIVGNDRDSILLLVNASEEYKNNSSEVIAFKNDVLYGDEGALPATPTLPAAIVPPLGALNGIVSRIRRLVQQIKSHDNYSEAIGQDLGVIGPDPPPPGEIKPTGEVTALPNFQSLIEFVKGDHDGVDIESQVGTETTWTPLAFDGFSPHIDTRPPQTPNTPEQRRYRLRYRDSDVPVGVFSDTLTVTVGA